MCIARSHSLGIFYPECRKKNRIILKLLSKNSVFGTRELQSDAIRSGQRENGAISIRWRSLL